MRFPKYPERTGNPALDNSNRRLNKRMRLAVRNLHFTTPRGRRRKKELTRIEGGNYIRLLNEVMLDLYARNQST